MDWDRHQTSSGKMVHFRFDPEGKRRAGELDCLQRHCDTGNKLDVTTVTNPLVVLVSRQQMGVTTGTKSLDSS